MTRALIWVLLATVVISPAEAGPKKPTRKDIRDHIDKLATEATQKEASDALVAMGKPVVKELIRALRKHKIKAARLHVAICIGRLKEDANDAIPALVFAQGDRYVTVREAAAKSLKTVGLPTKKMVKPLALLLSHEVETAVEAAGRTLASLKGDAVGAGPALVQRLELPFKKSETRIQLLAALSAMGRKGLPYLIKALDSKTKSVRLRMLDVINAMKRDGSSATNRVALMVAKDRDDGVRLRAIRTLRTIASPKVILRALAGQLQDKHKGIRSAAIVGLGALGPMAKPVVSGLVNALANDEDVTVRAAAAGALGQIGVPAKKLVKPLVRAISDKPAVRKKALGALGALGEPSASSLIRIAKKTSEVSLRLSVTALLGVKVKAPAGDVADALIERLSDKELTIRTQAVNSLAALGAPAVAPLVKLLDSEDKPLKLLAIRTLGNLGAAAEPAVDKLVELVGGLEPDFKNGARTALKKIASKAEGEFKARVEQALADG